MKTKQGVDVTWIKVLGLVCVGAVLTGCAGTTMRTARQLEAGDVVLSGGLDVPGFLYVPRAHVQGLYGLGAGDLSVHLGTTALTFNGGLGARAYLGDSWTAALQADAVLVPLSDADTTTSGLYSGVFELTTAARKTFGLYGGLHLSMRAFKDTNFEPLSLNAGLVGGVDVLMRDNFGLQFEVRVSPMIVDFQNQNSNQRLEPFANIYVGQIGLSLYKRMSAKREIEGSVPVERWNDPGNDPRDAL